VAGAAARLWPWDGLKLPWHGQEQGGGNKPGSSYLGTGNPGSEQPRKGQELPLVDSVEPGCIVEVKLGVPNASSGSTVTPPWTVIGPEGSGRTERAQDWAGPHWQKWRAGLNQYGRDPDALLGDEASPNGGLG
jgi:hypothetical protein